MQEGFWLFLKKERNDLGIECLVIDIIHNQISCSEIRMFFFIKDYKGWLRVTVPRGVILPELLLLSF